MFSLLMMWERIFQQRREIDTMFTHRDWVEGRLTDAQYRRKGGYLARRYIAESHARERQMQQPQQQVSRAPPAFGFRSRPFN